MGELFFFPLGDLLRQFSAESFFETGTGFGLGVQTARIFPFKRIWSVDIMVDEIRRLAPAFSSDPRVHLLAGRSTDALVHVLPKAEGNMIFWLDAHFPGAHHWKQGYNAERDIDTRLPLERELALIKQYRPGKPDVILIDDLRIYEKDNFQWGNMSDVGQGGLEKLDSSFLYSMFAETHVARRFLNHSGYLALVPKTDPQFEIVPNVVM
jgi:hypothetical protein